MADRPKVSKVIVRTNTPSRGVVSTDILLETEDAVSGFNYAVSLTESGTTMALSGPPTVSSNGSASTVDFADISDSGMFKNSPGTIDVSLEDSEGTETQPAVQVVYE